MLVNVVLVVAYGDVLNLTVSIIHRLVNWVHKALVRSDVQALVALENLGVNLRINLNSIGLNELATCLEVALALDALNLGEQLAKEATKLLVVINLNECLATSLLVLHNLDNFVLLALFVAPLTDELAVAHVRLLDVFAWLDAGELGHESVHDVLVVLSFVGVGVLEDAKLNEFGIGKIIEGK